MILYKRSRDNLKRALGGGMVNVVAGGGCRCRAPEPQSQARKKVVHGQRIAKSLVSSDEWVAGSKQEALTRCSLICTTYSSHLTPHPSFFTPHSVPLTPHPSLLTTHA